MTLQGVAVALIVPLCALYGAWSLLGARARRCVRRWLAATALLPAGWSRRLVAGPAGPTGCHCAGCDQAATTSPPTTPTQAIVQIHRSRR